MKKIFLIFLLVGLVGQMSAQRKINRSKSKATFTVTNLGVGVDGNIRGMAGEVKLDANDLASSYIKATLEVRAIRTGIEKRDKHLMDEDFFDKEKFPVMTFASKTIVMSGNGGYRTTGDLTIRDVTKEIIVDFQKEGGKYVGTFEIKRKDYDIDNDSLLTKGISDTVRIKFEVVLE